MSIWKHREIRKSTDAQENFTLNEGNTDLTKINFESKSLFIKRDDLNPTGSWKDRGSAYKVTQLFKDNITSGVLASSGNAAISLITYLNNFIPDFKLFIVVSEKVNQNKLKILNDLATNSRHEIIVAENPRKRSNEIAAENKIPNFRSSIDDEIVKGYWSLGFELADEILKNQIEAIFIPVSSGTAFVGIAQGLFMKLEKLEKMPQLVAVQTQSTSPVVDSFKSTKFDFPQTAQVEDSLADAIIDKTALRIPQILKSIRETQGYAVKVTNDEILNAKKFAEVNGIMLSNTSVLSIAAMLKDVNCNKAICIASGL